MNKQIRHLQRYLRVLMISIAIAYHSGYGHTRRVAEAVVAGVETEGATPHLINIAAMSEADWAALDAADAIVFGSPTYMGGVSAPFKTFMDSTSKRWLEQRWKDKIAAGFTNSGNWGGDKLGTLIQIMVYAMQHSMVWVGCDTVPALHTTAEGRSLELNRMGSFAGLMTLSGNESPDVTPPEDDLHTARLFGSRVAQVTRRFAAPDISEFTKPPA